MGLQKYNEKRDFTKTREPKGVKKNSKEDLRFVVQKHAASHLHYDFRLEIDGVLVSWAVPKGPSSNPSDRRLAVQTEDHPMDYIDFEGTIPKGEYGGGTVMVWDIGTYHAEGSDNLAEDKRVLRKQLKQGSIKVTLEGKKLKGSWHIVRMKGEERQWLLMKAKDDFADQKEFEPNSVLSGLDLKGIEKTTAVWSATKRPGDERPVSKRTSSTAKIKNPTSTTKEKASEIGFTASDLKDAVRLGKFPYDWRPQLATLAEEAFADDEWIFETKYDGYRAVAQIKDNEVKLISRNGISFNSKYPDIVEALKIIQKDMIIDGEVVVEDRNGKSNFQWLQHLDDLPHKGKLKFYVFDILYFAGFDLRQLGLIERKRILKAILPKHKSIVFSEHINSKGIKAFEESQKKGGEGIIAKKATSKYHIDKRTKDWLKIKTNKQQEMVIGGFTDPSGSRKGLGALLCGYYKEGEFHYSGKVGTGFTEAVLTDLRKKLNTLERKTTPFVKPPKISDIHWVKPELVAQIKFSEFTETGSMRHPVYLGLREDKKASEVTIEKAKVEIGKKQNSKGKLKGTAQKGSEKVELTNLDKVFWPDLKITKGDVITYYDAVADYILPYLKDRPQSLRRTPDGIKNEGFFQKNVAGMVPKWIKTRKIKSDSKEDSIEYLLCQDRDTLLFLANWGCIELNPWSSRVGSLNNPDYIIFDIDPKDAPFKNVIATALKVKEILDQLNVPSYIKTSGGNGLHIFIPVKPKYTYDQTRNFSHLVSQMVHRDLPKITSLERMPAKRKGKVYLDFLQNGKGKTMASIYSLRPREDATISVPLDWSEVNGRLNLKKFNIKTISKRLKAKGDLWKDFFSDAIDLKEILKAIT